MVQQSSSSSPSILRYTYDVFLSFRGEDTRFGFTGNLYSALNQKGIFTFIDDDALRKGEEITPSLCKAIQESRMSIIIFSKNYASSSFCLDELVHILECYTKQNMWILPVFYDIEPSHVRHQKGSYEEAFAEHDRGRYKHDIEKLRIWRLALRHAADLSGLHFTIGREYEFEFIRKIIEDVSSKLNRRSLYIADHPVGLQARMEQIQRLMGAESDSKVTMLGIHGMGGIGKSTLARAIYNLIADQFEGSYFLANVREKSIKHGLVHIQETMLSELVGEKNINLGDVYQGIPLLKQRLCRKKVLLVLDDIDKKEQLQATAGCLDWFGLGSIIIITTRDKHLLDIHGVDKLYEVNELDDIEAYKLFTWNAFKSKQVDANYMAIIKRAIYYARGLPLALEIIGSNLFGKASHEWDSALKAYVRIPNGDVQKILRVSYDSLDTNEREIFLDIACFFSGCTLRHVTNMLEARGFRPKYGTRVLQEKSLVKIDKCKDKEIVIMHDLIQSMGKEIVREQSNWPQKRNRLWFYEDIACVLEKNKENDEIEAMLFDMQEDQEVQWNQKVLGKMKNLRMMLTKKNPSFLRGPKELPNSLRVLEWWGYPVASLPSNFQYKNLVILDLSYSCFKWDNPLQNSKVMRRLILRGCKNIRRIPDVSGFPNLTELCVCECTKLIEIHNSVGFLYNLQRFCAEGCTKLKIGPCGIKLTSLEYLSLQDCSSLVIFPEILAPMLKLNFVDLDGTAIKNLPFSMQNLEGLRKLSLRRCKNLEINGQSNFFQILPLLFPNLTQLNLQESNLTILPACIEECVSLKCIDVSNCMKLQEIRGLPQTIIEFSACNTALQPDSLTLNMLLRLAIGFSRKAIYVLSCHQIPEWFDHFSRGNSLCFWFRNELPFLTVCAGTGVMDNIQPSFPVKFSFFVTINDAALWISGFSGYSKICIESGHIFLINAPNDSHHPINSDIRRALKMNEWIRGNILLEIATEDSHDPGIIKWIGIYVKRAFSRVEDVRFTDPYPPNDVGNQQMFVGEAPDIQQQQQSVALFNPTISLGSEIEEQPLNYARSNSDSQEPASVIDCSNDRDGAFLDYQAMAPSFPEMQNGKAQIEVGTLISEVSTEFTHRSRYSIERSLKIESTASESHKVDQVEEGLEKEPDQQCYGLGR